MIRVYCNMYYILIMLSIAMIAAVEDSTRHPYGQQRGLISQQQQKGIEQGSCYSDGLYSI